MEIILERLPLSELEDALVLLTEIFTHEQNVPASLHNIKEDLNPIWWCARADTAIVGIVASWVENNEWHWGRFATKKSHRGLGIGKKLAVFSLSETCSIGAEKIHVEARDTTAGILKKLGGKVTGEPENFYGESVTPMIITKYDFINSHSL